MRAASTTRGKEPKKDTEVTSKDDSIKDEQKNRPWRQNMSKRSEENNQGEEKKKGEWK